MAMKRQCKYIQQKYIGLFLYVNHSVQSHKRAHIILYNRLIYKKTVINRKKYSKINKIIQH